LAFVITALEDDNPRVILAAVNLLCTCIMERARLARFDAFLQSVEARLTIMYVMHHSSLSRIAHLMINECLIRAWHGMDGYGIGIAAF
jgi:hypothetical protein